MVEDSPDDQVLIQRSLKAAKCDLELRVAHDGAAALEVLGASDAAPPKFVLLDLKMPRVGGLEVLQAVHETAAGRAVPIVVFTSSTDPSDIRRSYEAGANAYVRKPIELDEFQATVQRIVDFWVQANISPAPDGVSLRRAPANRTSAPRSFEALIK